VQWTAGAVDRAIEAGADGVCNAVVPLLEAASRLGNGAVVNALFPTPVPEDVPEKNPLGLCFSIHGLMSRRPEL
jgi:hypothetical protein